MTEQQSINIFDGIPEKVVLVIKKFTYLCGAQPLGFSWNTETNTLFYCGKKIPKYIYNEKDADRYRYRKGFRKNEANKKRHGVEREEHYNQIRMRQLPCAVIEKPKEEIDMTKYSDKLKDLLDRWFKNKKNLNIADYEMLKDLCNEVLK